MNKTTMRYLIGILAAGLVMLALLPVLMGLRRVERIAGSTSVQPLPTPAEAKPLDGLTVNISFLDGPRTFPAETIFADVLEQTPDGFYILYSETGLNEYVHYWFGTDVIVDDPNIREATLVLTAGTVSLHAEINLRVGWQPVKLHYAINPDGRTVDFAGATVGEATYTAADDSYLGAKIAELEAETNAALTDLVFLHPERGEVHIDQIVIGRGWVQIRAR